MNWSNFVTKLYFCWLKQIRNLWKKNLLKHLKVTCFISTVERRHHPTSTCPFRMLVRFKFEHLQMVQEVQGSLSLHADQADLQYHGIQPDPEDLKAHQDPTESKQNKQLLLSSTWCVCAASHWECFVVLAQLSCNRGRRGWCLRSWLIIKLTGGPSSPGSPFSPGAPAAPRSPASPCLPGRPASPRAPFGPSLPAWPAGPTAPGFPCGGSRLVSRWPEHHLSLFYFLLLLLITHIGAGRSNSASSTREASRTLQRTKDRREERTVHLMNIKAGLKCKSSIEFKIHRQSVSLQLKADSLLG